MTDVRVRGLRFNVHTMGKGQETLVFLHGLVVDNLSSWYMTLAAALASRTRIVLYDMRGHGMSERPPTGYSLNELVLDLEALLDALGLRDTAVTLVSNSSGGAVAVAFAVRHPERVRSLVLIDSHFGEEGFGEYMAATVGRSEETADATLHELYERWFRRHLGDAAPPSQDEIDVGDRVERIAKRGRQSKLVLTAIALIEETSLIEDLRDSPTITPKELASIKCPVLAVYGEDSYLLEKARQLPQLLPNCALIEVPGGAHGLIWQATDRLRQELASWITTRSQA